LYSWPRSQLDLVEREPVTEDDGLKIREISQRVECSSEGKSFEIALSAEAYSGLRSWVESAPPGDMGKVVERRRFRDVGGSCRPPAGCQRTSPDSPLAYLAIMKSKSESRFKYLAVRGFTPPSRESPCSSNACHAARSARRTIVDAKCN